ncbi:MAG: hypothetical protein K8U57_22555 [Planctomycetes bacterium]|nr:hypothetical protein [Planctomycetota bacterium]
MRITRLLLVGLLLTLSVEPARADGGTVRASVRKGPWQITVFTSPTPLRAGAIDVSVLVQNAATGQPDSSVRVWVRAEPLNESTRRIAERATKENATNKLLLAAVFELSEPGWWHFRVTIYHGDDTEEVAFDLEAGEPLPRWMSLAGWIAWPVGVILVFAVHQRLVRRKNARRRL